MALFVFTGENTVELNPRIRTNKVVVKNLDLESCLLPKEFLSRVADKAKFVEYLYLRFWIQTGLMLATYTEDQFKDIAKTLFEEALASFAGKKSYMYTLLHRWHTML